MSGAVGLQRSAEAPVGVFDSGVGGLTVLNALRERLPDESYLYLGDTARVPYGTKSVHSITRYSLQAAELLVERGVKCLVIACNTASAVALDVLQRQYAPLPVLGVVEPGARAGCEASRTGRIAVLATESTIRGGAYQRAICGLRPDARVLVAACPLFVALAEEGWVEGSIVEAVARRYLEPLFVDPAIGPDALVLGCTHFPVLTPTLRSVLGPGVRIVDSARTTAVALADLLSAAGIAAPRPPAHAASLVLLSTDDEDRFRSVGSRFLRAPIDRVEVVDLPTGFRTRADGVP